MLRKSSTILLLLFVISNSVAKAVEPVVWNIATAPLVISGSSTNDYIVTGQTDSNNIRIEAGFRGTVTLRDVSIQLTGRNFSPIFVQGEDDRSNLDPITVVDIVLEGTNLLRYTRGTEVVCSEDEYTWRRFCVEWDSIWMYSCIRTEITYRRERRSVCLREEVEEIDGRFVTRCVEWGFDYVYVPQSECVEYDPVLGHYVADPSSPCVRQDSIQEPVCRTYTRDGFAAFHVDQGAQINISAIDPTNNASGTLSAIVTPTTLTQGGGGAGIGASRAGTGTASQPVPQQATATATIIGGCNTPATTAGGNIVISSGTITARGGSHAAGIGGGWHAFYDGMIVIYGGIVDSRASFHAAGIGSGCPTAHGVVQCYAPNGAIIVLPPAQITAMGFGNAEQGERADLALAGMANIIYIGDPESPTNIVHTIDTVPFANIFVDLSESPNIATVINAIVPAERLDIHRIQFGTAGSDGFFQFHGIINDYTTFFTDAHSLNPETFGRPYQSRRHRLPEDQTDRTVILDLLPTNIAIYSTPSVDLMERYTAENALNNAFRIKIHYLDPVPMENVVFNIIGGALSDFQTENIRFLGADSLTEIQVPTNLVYGDIIHIVIPLRLGRLAGEYADVFRLSGMWGDFPTGYIRQVITQTVVERSRHHINLAVNNPEYGSTVGEGTFEYGAVVHVEAFSNYCYRFANWTHNGAVVSNNNSFVFTVSEDVNLVANFFSLDFNTYVSTFWYNTFMLNLGRLRDDGYQVVGARWFKNGVQQIDTRTINEFSYSAGPNTDDFLEFSPTFYTFLVMTANRGNLCSSRKMLTNYTKTSITIIDNTSEHNLLMFPNPITSGNTLTIKGLEKGTPIQIYNQQGVRVGNFVATTDEMTAIELHLPEGIYIIRANQKSARIIVK